MNNLICSVFDIKTKKFLVKNDEKSYVVLKTRLCLKVPKTSKYKLK
jgi:hypothetical protein